jgi:hypothetical protein
MEVVEHTTVVKDDEVDVAVLVEVAEGEGALEVDADKVPGQDGAKAGDELIQDLVEVEQGSPSFSEVSGCMETS